MYHRKKRRDVRVVDPHSAREGVHPLLRLVNKRLVQTKLSSLLRRVNRLRVTDQDMPGSSVGWTWTLLRRDRSPYGNSGSSAGSQPWRWHPLRIRVIEIEKGSDVIRVVRVITVVVVAMESPECHGILLC